jgi:MFS family permease
MLIAFRAVQGIGGATIFATSLALLAQTFNEILLFSGLLAIVAASSPSP